MTIQAELKQPSVLFVCTANRIRSPIAALLFRNMLHDRQSNWRQWRVESAGTWASPGMPAMEEAQTDMAERGFTINSHRSRLVNHALLAQFRLILTMETGHKEALLLEDQKLYGRIFVLTEMAGESISIEDPFGKPQTEYHRTVDEIEYWLDQGFERIVRHANCENMQ